MSNSKKRTKKITELENENTILQFKKMDIESGLLGKFFGTGSSSSVNIAGLVLVLLVITALIFTLFNLQVEDETKVSEFWKILLPIMTIILGYLFGKSR